MAIKSGTTGNDTVTGTTGWDTLYGLAGNDVLLGGTGGDILSGGDGNDVLIGGAGSDSLHGGAGADVFKYTSFNDAKYDYITDFSKWDKIDFSAITDAKFIGSAQFSGVAGEIRYYASPYSFDSLYDRTYFSIDADGDAESDMTLSLAGLFSLTSAADNAGILVIAENQTLEGTSAADTLTGGAGNDILSGLASYDLLRGGDGIDILQGGNGNDILVGGSGRDELTGGAGNDTFRFNSPADFSGYLQYQTGLLTNGGDTITDFSAGDKIALNFEGIKFISDAEFSGTPGEYRYQYPDSLSYPYDSFITLSFDFDGDKGTDAAIKLANMPSTMVLEETSPSSNQLVIAPNQTLNGSDLNDSLTGGNGHDTLNGFAGNDTLVGGNGNDSLRGGDGANILKGAAGNDELLGGSGVDVLIGGLGTDTLSGGLGNDVFRYNSLAELETYEPYRDYAYPDISENITDFSVGDRVNLSAISGLSFVGIGNDFTGIANQIRVYNGIYAPQLQIDSNGDKQPDYQLFLSDESGGLVAIEETSPGSLIFQLAKSKLLIGTSANDSLTGGNGADVLEGLAGNDLLQGNHNEDFLMGGDGADTLIGGLSADVLTGGLGKDMFKFNSISEFNEGNAIYYPYRLYDEITDFTTGDKINLSAIDANSNLANNQAFTFIGSNDFTKVAGQLMYQPHNEGIFGDVDGDGSADFSIIVTGSPTLTASSFIL